MAVTASAEWMCQIPGNDVNGGGFDPGVAGMATDGAATVATGASPVFTSVSYSFVAGDAGHWIYIKSGSNWIPGWYKIASVSAGAATLSAAIGAATLATHGLNIAVGAATTASPTGATWSVDYSRNGGPFISYTDMVIDATTNTKYTSAANPVKVNVIGNVIAVSAGAGWTVQRNVVISISGTVATCDKAIGTTSSTGGTGKLGGAFATDGMAGSVAATSNRIWGQYNATAFVATSTSANVSGGRLSLPSGSTTASAVLRGYDTVPGDETANRPTFQWGVNASSVARITPTSNSVAENFIIDCNRSNFTNTRGLTNNGNGATVRRVKVMGASAIALNVASTALTYIDIEVTDCTASAAITCGIGSRSIWLGLSVHDCAITGMSVGSGSILTISKAAFANITTAGSTGIQYTAAGLLYADSVDMYSIASHGFDLQAAMTNAVISNSNVEGAGGYGFNVGTAMDTLVLLNDSGYNNTSGNYPTANISPERVIGFLALSASAYVNAAGNNFTPTAASGLRASAFPSSYGGLSSPSYGDRGAVQSQATGVMGTRIFSGF